jgi:hypothetical protein
VYFGGLLRLDGLEGLATVVDSTQEPVALMSELQCCVYCGKTIKPNDEFVKVEPPPVSFGEPVSFAYAHAECHDALIALDPEKSAL